MVLISDSAREKKREAGRAGGYATFRRLGREGMRENGLKGGRPRLLTLAQIESQLSSHNNKINERGNRLQPNLASTEQNPTRESF